jgi:hypothetical protein
MDPHNITGFLCSCQIRDVRKLGVTCVLVGSAGMSVSLLQSGIEAFRATLRNTPRT